MNKLASILSAVALTGVTAIGSGVPAQAQSFSMSFGQRHQVIQTYCDRYPSDPDCNSFYQGNWRDRDYQRFYSTRRAPIDNISTGILGFTFGAALGSIIANGANNSGDVVVRRANGYDSHVQACYNRYRSYDEETNTFLGFDGVRHECRL
ncbi:BA14K family protein [Devosia sp.]|uniref:BA14K family protein n=1 Tax=Devosia sp. TaxID=1871048 RepID=UPI0025BD9FA2|nr:BA14K family protein [Devosia sp.]